MAIHSVSAPMPGLDDLVNYGINRRFENPERIARAAENELTPLVDGVSAIGMLLASSAYNDDFPPSKETLTGVGFLLNALGNMISAFEAIKSNAVYQHDHGHELEGTKAPSEPLRREATKQDTEPCELKVA